MWAVICGAVSGRPPSSRTSPAGSVIRNDETAGSADVIDVGGDVERPSGFVPFLALGTAQREGRYEKDETSETGSMQTTGLARCGNYFIFCLEA